MGGTMTPSLPHREVPIIVKVLQQSPQALFLSVSVSAPSYSLEPDGLCVAPRFLHINPFVSYCLTLAITSVFTD